MAVSSKTDHVLAVATQNLNLGPPLENSQDAKTKEAAQVFFDMAFGSNENGYQATPPIADTLLLSCIASKDTLSSLLLTSKGMYFNLQTIAHAAFDHAILKLKQTDAIEEIFLTAQYVPYLNFQEIGVTYLQKCYRLIKIIEELFSEKIDVHEFLLKKYNFETESMRYLTNSLSFISFIRAIEKSRPFFFAERISFPLRNDLPAWLEQKLRLKELLFLNQNKCEKIDTLILRNNPTLTGLPKELKYFKNLETLRLDQNAGLSDISETVSLQKLRILSISNTLVKRVPKELLELPLIEEIDVRNSLVFKLEEAAYSPSLHYLHCNRGTEIPVSLSERSGTYIFF